MRKNLLLTVGLVAFALGLSACAGSPMAPSPMADGSLSARGGAAAREGRPNNGNNGNHNGQEKNGNNRDGDKHEDGEGGGDPDTTPVDPPPPPDTTTDPPPPPDTTTEDPGTAQTMLSVSAQTVDAGAPVTVTLTNGTGGTYDWLALAATGADEATYIQWTHVGTGVTTFSWTVNMPMTPGTYEFRYFPGSSAPRTATSPTVTVQVPETSLSISAQNVSGGASVTVTLRNGLGGTYDWLALAAAGASDTSYLQWTYVGAGVTTRTWTVTMPAAAGTYEFRLFLNGVYIRAATSPTVTVN